VNFSLFSTGWSNRRGFLFGHKTGGLLCQVDVFTTGYAELLLYLRRAVGKITLVGCVAAFVTAGIKVQKVGIKLVWSG